MKIFLKIGITLADFIVKLCYPTARLVSISIQAGREAWEAGV
jgi:hypothetical protein